MVVNKKEEITSTNYNTVTDLTKKTNVSNSKSWWLRSPLAMDESYFSYVSTRGNELGNGGYNASIGLAIIPGFSI